MTISNSVKALAARATMSKQDIRQRLHEDHLRFRELTKKMAEGNRTDGRASAFAQLKPALVAHARVEELVAYNALIRAAPNAEDDTLGREGYVEHHIADHLVRRLSELDPATDDWRAHAKVLHEVLGHHIDEEETDIFAKLGGLFSREELDELGDRFEREKDAFVPPGPAKTRPPRSKPSARRTSSSTRKTSRRSSKTAARKKSAAKSSRR